MIHLHLTFNIIALIADSMSQNPHISVISPVYQSARLVDTLVERISTAVAGLTAHFEIILVEDGGTDDSWEQIQQNCTRDAHVRGIKLSRNFGQQAAIQAGLDASRGDFVVVLDCDLQDRPEEIPGLYAKAMEGFDVVIASRQERQDGRFKRMLSSMFNRAMAYLTETDQDASVANFALYSRKAVDALNEMRDYYRYYPLMSQWIGFPTVKVKTRHAQREDGHSSYSFSKSLKLAIDTMLMFSDKPLRLTIRLGVYLSLASIAAAMVLIALYFTGDVSAPGWTSLALLICFFSGSIISVLGIVGLYVGRIFETVKMRPTYLIDQETNQGDV